MGCCLSRGDGRAGIWVSGVCIGPGGAGADCAGVVAAAGGSSWLHVKSPTFIFLFFF